MEIGLDDHGNAVSQPFDSVTEVLHWTPNKPCRNITDISTSRVTSISEQPSRPEKCSLSDELAGLSELQDELKRFRASRPQLLVCHDMCGGYLDDRFSQGCSNMSPYRFYHWQLIDTFVYFSHHFVTIPPIGWIKAAHKHGVTVLGTVITEWDDGRQICKEVLGSKESIDLVTSKLAEMAKFFGFDGWLINIENKIEADQVPQLQLFVQQLATKCHSLLDTSQVLWYDSVTSTGELSWQNELNALNEMFFHVCDGIYLNYNITEEKLASSRALASNTGRQFDVYVGIDVFGRLTPDGGGFNSREPLKMILDHGLSCAVFAPGWVYECLGQSQFDSNEIMFWGILSELLIPRSVKVPFSTSFCQGYGEKYFMKGQVLSDAPWYNLGLQQVQPTFSQSQFVSYTVSKILEHEDTDQEITGEKKSEEPLTEGEEKVDEHPTEGEKKEKLRIEVDSCELQLACPKMRLALCDAYQGGGCLSLTAKRLESLPVLFRIFKVDATRETSLHISVTWKMPQDSSCTFGIVLSNDGDKTEKGLWVLCTETDLSDAQKNIVEKMTLQDKDQAVTPSSATLVQYVNCNKKDRSSTSKDGDWLTSNFTVDLRDRNLNQELSLSVVLIPSIQQEVKSCTDSHMSLWIGHLQVHGDTDSLPIAKSPCVGHLKCLQAEVSSQLSKENVKEIMTNPCFTLENSCLSTVDPAIASQHQVQDTAHNSLMVSSSAQEKNPSADISELMPDKVDTLNSISRTILDLTTEDPATPGSNLASPYTLYVLKWNVTAKGVDHFLVFCNDQTGARHFIGHALTNSFVYKHCGQHGNIRSFTIQPVMSLTNFPREETLFIL